MEAIAVRPRLSSPFRVRVRSFAHLFDFGCWQYSVFIIAFTLLRGSDCNCRVQCPEHFRSTDYRNEKIDIRFRKECESMIDELKGKFNGMSIEINKKKELQHLDQESTIPLNEIISQLPQSIAITPVLPTMEPEDSLIMRNEELSTILEKESDEFIKSSVEDLVPILSESEDTSESDSDCNLSLCDDLSPINVYEEKSMTFSNPLLDSNDDFASSDDESLSDEDNIESKNSYVSNLDEPALLVTPLFDANEDECFDPSGKINEIDAFLDMDIENGYHDLEGDIIYLEILLINDTIPNLPPDVFLDHDPKNLKDEPDNEDLKSMVKVFDPDIHEKTFSPTYVRLPFEDRHYLSLTFVIRIFLPYLTYSMDSFLLRSSGSDDTIFDLGISVFSFYSLEPAGLEGDEERLENELYKLETSLRVLACFGDAAAKKRDKGVMWFIYVP
ncbi:hypothetical protein Tco_0697073 [Tanacetum coccineum]